jgi:hypothetical protein
MQKPSWGLHYFLDEVGDFHMKYIWGITQWYIPMGKSSNIKLGLQEL